MNKKGFSLIELLAVIVVIGILLTIATAAILYFVNQAKRTAFENAVYRVFDATEIYKTNNRITDLYDIKTVAKNNTDLDIENNPFTSGNVLETNDLLYVENVTDGVFCATGSKANLTITDESCDQILSVKLSVKDILQNAVVLEASSGTGGATYEFSMSETDSNFNNWTVKSIVPEYKFVDLDENNKTYYFKVRVTDVNGNTTESNSVKVTLSSNTNAPNIGEFITNDSNTVKLSNYTYYQKITREVEVWDNDGLKEIKYCITTGDKCDPNINVDDVSGKSKNVSIALDDSHKNNQKICIQATNEAGGTSSVKCDTGFQVDSTAPEVENLMADYNSSSSYMSLSSSYDDAESGVRSVTYYIDGDSTRNAFTANCDEYYKELKVIVVNNAGIETEVTKNINITTKVCCTSPTYGSSCTNGQTDTCADDVDRTCTLIFKSNGYDWYCASGSNCSQWTTPNILARTDSCSSTNDYWNSGNWDSYLPGWKSNFFNIENGILYEYSTDTKATWHQAKCKYTGTRTIYEWR